MATAEPETPTRVGDWMQTYTGRQFWPLDPRHSEIDIRDIAHALSLQCRFAGHVRTFYSVAEHSIRVERYIRTRGEPESVQLWGLLHDASEAYLVDLPRPIKVHMANYLAAERVLELVLAERFGLTWPRPSIVTEADQILLATEQRDLMTKPPTPWDKWLTEEPLVEKIYPMKSWEAENQYMTRYRELTDPDSVACNIAS